jgi:hypothetical protein
MWWHNLTQSEQLFFIVGSVSNVLFVAYVIYQLSGGDDLDAPDDAGLIFLSFRSLTAFGMFLGWTGLVVLKQGGSLYSAILAGVLAGVVAVWLAYLLIRWLLKMQSSGTLDMANAVGCQGVVHLIVPAKGQGKGKVSIEIQGALRELDAITEGGVAIPTGGKVIVVSVVSEDTLVVQSIG